MDSGTVILAIEGLVYANGHTRPGGGEGRAW